jgi:ankyrin repeat protein
LAAAAIALVVLCGTTLTIAALFLRVDARKTAEVVGPDEPVYYLILRQAPLREIEDALRRRPHVVTEFTWHGRTLLCDAASVRRQDVVELLLAMGADPNGSDNGASPLISAISGGDPGVVAVLLDHGASPFTPKPPFGYTACELGLDSDSEQITALMQEAKSRRAAANDSKSSPNEEEKHLDTFSAYLREL